MRSLAASVVAVVLTLAGAGHAESVGDLAERGHAAMKAGRHAEALAAFEEAESRSSTPPLSLARGRALEALGRLVEAREAYRAAAEPLPEEAPRAFRRARDGAIAALAALEPRLPVIAVELGPELRRAAAVTLDGSPVPAGTTRLVVDPGPHVVTAEATGQIVRREVVAQEGRTHRLRLDEPGEPGSVLYGGRLFWGVALGAASLGLTATFVYSTIRLDAIRSDPGYQAFSESVRIGDDGCAAARSGTPGVDYLAAPGAWSRGEMIAACDDADTLKALQIVTVPTAVVTGALAGYLLANVVESAPSELGLIPDLGPGRAGFTVHVAF